MSSNTAVFPGSFDPLTLGHVDIIQRALPLFEKLIIAIGVNSEKKSMFSLEDRIAAIKSTFEGETKIEVTSYSGLTIDFCKSVNANYLVRGLRNPADFEFEKAIANTNRALSDIDTVFLLTTSGKSFISSSIVREIVKYNGDISKLVPEAVLNLKAQ
ncbi:MAG: pantetheine-phosphate adenylyltransferase [Flavobacteriaceae bacterium]|jgi:pantetheine-phosphate adenylyltransferase|nr:pantetheine-phosphate adenylyltransferase [Flavobacteriaceae bacterium]NVJ73103.1 pantetheine-phosphate adenylyltransferase [Flavobacteriaceae bacterium]